MELVNLSDFWRLNPNSTEKQSRLEQFLPLNSSRLLAEIVAAIITDGHLELYKGSRPKKIVFYSDNMSSLKWFEESMEKIFRTKPKLVEYVPKYGMKNKKRYKVVINDASVARVLLMIGAPGGNKTKSDFNVPNWIMNGSDKIKSGFLQKIFDFDGSIPVKKPNRRATWNIQYFTTKQQDFSHSGERYCNSLISLLDHFGIRASSCEHKMATGNHTFIVTILRQDSIIAFWKKVGYSIREKQERLNQAYENIISEISFRSNEISNLLDKFKMIRGTDKRSIDEINQKLGSDYTKRMFEHWRRGEIKVPFPVLRMICKECQDDVFDYISLSRDLFEGM
jgi:hypothetical protein